MNNHIKSRAAINKNYSTNIYNKCLIASQLFLMLHAHILIADAKNKIIHFFGKKMPGPGGGMKILEQHLLK